MAPQSRRVTSAGLEAVRRKEAPHRIFERDFFDGPDAVRAAFAALIGAEAPQRVAIVPSSSYAFAQALRNTPLRADQTVVTVAEEFPSLVYTLRARAEEVGAELRFVERPGIDDGVSWTEKVLEAIDDATALVAMSTLHWTDGTAFDVTRVAARARDVGAYFMLDGTQSIGAVPFDVTSVQPDVLVCPAYKWLTGPYGIGVAYFGSRFDDGVPIEQSWMIREGSDDFAGLVNYTDRYRSGAVRYDVGESSNFVLIPMLQAALDQVREWTPIGVQDYARTLTEGLLTQLEERGYDAGVARPRPGHIFGLPLPRGTDPRVLKERLAQRRIYVSVRGSALRVSVHLFNDEADMEALHDALLGV